MKLKQGVGFSEYKNYAEAQKQKIEKLEQELSALKTKFENDGIENDIAYKKDIQIPRWKRTYSSYIESLRKIDPEAFDKFSKEQSIEIDFIDDPSTETQSLSAPKLKSNKQDSLQLQINQLKSQIKTLNVRLNLIKKLREDLYKIKGKIDDVEKILDLIYREKFNEYFRYVSGFYRDLEYTIDNFGVNMGILSLISDSTVQEDKKLHTNFKISLFSSRFINLDVVFDPFEKNSISITQNYSLADKVNKFNEEELKGFQDVREWFEKVLNYNIDAQIPRQKNIASVQIAYPIGKVGLDDKRLREFLSNYNLKTASLGVDHIE